ncbi:MAG: Spy/CpxP family protein refolding chaperone [Xanthomonadales bacterium]|jgi:Spy/CpxP family protein refolding chaperone|nr:Spy/CpxP family protein refolding chaperone [Xanthomonadales bacterium]
MYRRILHSLCIVALLALPMAAPVEAGPFGRRVLGDAAPGMGRQPPPSAEQLGLNSAQKAEWQAIRRDAKALRAATLDQLEAELSAASAALARPDANLPAIRSGIEAIAQVYLSEQQSLKARRLAFYQSLSAEQQAKVREWLAREAERTAALIRALRILRESEA